MHVFQISSTRYINVIELDQLQQPPGQKILTDRHLFLNFWGWLDPRHDKKKCQHNTMKKIHKIFIAII